MRPYNHGSYEFEFVLLGIFLVLGVLAFIFDLFFLAVLLVLFVVFMLADACK